jgi:hypothetical protein
LWISDAVGAGRIRPADLAYHGTSFAAATDWLKANLNGIPESLRPDPCEFDDFAAFFSTYLTSSFDVVARPGTRGTGPRAGGVIGLCDCPLCLRMANAPHLQTKKITGRDKRRANVLMGDFLARFARDKGVELGDECIDQLVAGEETRRPLAYLTYGYWLIERLSGDSDGPAILALWRIIAWEPRGGTRPGFKLELNDILEAEKTIAAAITTGP